MELFTEKQLMGGSFKIGIFDVDEKIFNDMVEEIYAEGLRLQKIFNFYDKNSELAVLNKKRAMTISSELLEVITIALKYCELSDGKYDISLGNNFLERKSGKEISKIECDYRNIVISGGKVLLNHEDVMIDLGSIAKGFIVDKLIEYMKEKFGIENGWIDARGDMGFFGDAIHRLEIQHPRKAGEIIDTIEITNKAVATSGDYNQYCENYNKSHIIGKRNFISATVIADNLTIADVIATCSIVCDDKKIKSIIKFGNSKAILFNEKLDKKVYN
jgi:thiamine biosynthesis lipoprotein